MKTASATRATPNAETPFTNRARLAKRWLCSTMKLKRMEKAGLLPFLKMGKQVLYRMADVERIEQQAEVRFT
jgi:hypothetical protein